jgi:putative ABC transport system ATP-binding protein
MSELPKAAVLVEGLTKTYDTGGTPVHALRGVSFEVMPGEFVAIMGPSGSGKTTMMNLLGCLDRPTAGRYLLDGEEVSTLNDDELAYARNKKIGFVFQSYNLLARTTALENVTVPMKYAGVRHGEQVERAKDALQKVGLGDRLDHKPNEMSGGQQQRVAIARALVTRPAILMADEPTGNLDTRTSEEIMALLQGLNDGGMTVVMVTHEEDIAEHCKRIIRFRDGRIENDGPVLKRRVLADFIAEHGEKAADEESGE